MSNYSTFKFIGGHLHMDNLPLHIDDQDKKIIKSGGAMYRKTLIKGTYYYIESGLWSFLTTKDWSKIFYGP